MKNKVIHIMFDVGWLELLVITIVLVLFIGPKELPGVLRFAGNTIGTFRRLVSDFQSQFNSIIEDKELRLLRKNMNDIYRCDERSQQPPKHLKAQSDQTINDTLEDKSHSK